MLSHIFTDRVNVMYLSYKHIHGGRAGLLVAVSHVTSRFHVGLVTEAFMNHLAVDFSSAAVSQVLLPYKTMEYLRE